MTKRLVRKDKVKKLDKNEVRKLVRKHVNSYQIEILDRLTGGQDHWNWYAGKTSSRKEFIFMILQKRPPAGEVIARIMSDQPKGESVSAFILDGRWVARCPDCGGQEVVDENDPLFVCLNRNCLNIVNGHYPRLVTFPPESTTKSINEILLARTNPVNRNWVPGEKVKDLERENTNHGMPKRAVVEERVDG